jgi:glycosyltransferase involved in cell wall biosynthesis
MELIKENRKKPKLSIVVPCYNEAGAIPLNYKKACDLVSRESLQIIFLDNGSTDKTGEIFQALAIDSPKSITFLTIKPNKGYGNGLKFGLSHCRGEYLGWTHGDGQTDLMDLDKVLKIISDNPDVGMIKGSRFNRTSSEKFTSKMLEYLCSILFMRRFSEINAQPSVFRYDYIYNNKSYSDDLLFDLDAYTYAVVGHVSSVRFDVEFPPREHGQSSWNRGLLSKAKFIARNIGHIAILRVKLCGKK